MSSFPKSVLVLGAGELGSAILSALTSHHLYKSNHIKLSVLLRPSSTAKLPAESINTIRLDLGSASEAALEEVFRNFHTVISCTGFAGGSGTQIKITKAAISAKVERFFPWQFGVDYDVVGKNSAQDLWDEQLIVRDLLRAQQDVKWVIVSTGMFTSFLFEQSFGVVDLKNNTVRPLGGTENKVTVTSPKDIGTVVAELALSDTKTNGIVYTAGDTITYGELILILQQLTNKTPQILDGEVMTLKHELAQDPDDTLKKYRVAFAQGVGVSWDVQKTFNAKKAIPMESVRDWVNTNLRNESIASQTV